MLFLALIHLLLVCHLVLDEQCIDLLVLAYLREHVARHVSIVRRLVVVLKKLFALVIGEAFIDIKLKAEDVIQSLVVLALLIDLTKDRLAEVVSLEREYFGVEGAREQFEPAVDELLICVRQRTDELAIQVQNVIHHVVAN